VSSVSADVNRRILIVDDNQAIHGDFRKILAGPGTAEAAMDELAAMLFSTAEAARPSEFQLDSAFQGREALERVTTANRAGRPYALAFVDMRMPPGWDGLETIEHIWRADPFLQVVICSAYSDHSWEDLRSRLGESDALLVIKKPFDPIEVVQSAHALTAKWTLARRARAYVENLEAAVRARTAELEAVAAQLAEEIRRRDRVEAELRLAQRLEAVGQLAAGVAHEINTPIQYVSDSLHFVRDGSLGLVTMARAMRASAGQCGNGAGSSELAGNLASIAEEADLPYLEEHLPEALDRIQDGVGRVATIVRAMKELAHPGQREMAPTDLNRALQNALQLTANAYRYVADPAVDLGDLPLVTCLAAEMNQVFINLIVNAAHAMERCGQDGAPRGRLSITTRTDGPDVVISIADCGHGIPEAIRERIFDAFYTTKPVGRGTGQGLAISRAIVVDRHGGRLTFDSTIGVGTTFHVRLPVAGNNPDGAASCADGG
jgi:two-component system NtrC family sensor kinase